MNASESFHKQNILALVGGYATPLAVGLVGTGLIMAPLDPFARQTCFFLMIFSLVFNIVFVPSVARLSDRTRSFLAKSRATLNLWINVALLILMARVWQPIWLILTLPAVATSIYGTRQRTLVTGCFLSAVLVAVNFFLRLNTPLEWGLVAAKSAFIILTSLMINDLVHAANDPQ